MSIERNLDSVFAYFRVHSYMALQKTSIKTKLDTVTTIARLQVAYIDQHNFMTGSCCGLPCKFLVHPPASIHLTALLSLDAGLQIWMLKARVSSLCVLDASQGLFYEPDQSLSFLQRLKFRHNYEVICPYFPPLYHLIPRALLTVSTDIHRRKDATHEFHTERTNLHALRPQAILENQARSYSTPENTNPVSKTQVASVCEQRYRIFRVASSSPRKVRRS